MSVTNPTYTVSERESALIARATRLRSRMWALHYGRAAAFSRHLAAEWKLSGMTGVGSACFDLQLELAHVVGAHECYSEARAIASACGVFV